MQQLKSQGAQGVIVIAGDPLTPTMEQTARQAGYNPTFCTTASGSPIYDAKKYGAGLAGTLISSFFPPPTATVPGIKAFNAEANAAGKAGVPNVATSNRDDPMLAAWTGMHGLALVAGSISGKITPKSLETAMSKTKNLNVEGVLDWSPGGKGPSVVPRDTNGSSYISIVKNNTFQLLSPTPINVFKATGI
jgi:ABC-type branched-subunit amino acid transport system substrate-binding protein